MFYFQTTWLPFPVREREDTDCMSASTISPYGLSYNNQTKLNKTVSEGIFCFQPTQPPGNSTPKVNDYLYYNILN